MNQPEPVENDPRSPKEKIEEEVHTEASRWTGIGFILAVFICVFGSILAYIILRIAGFL